MLSFKAAPQTGPPERCTPVAFPVCLTQGSPHFRSSVLITQLLQQLFNYNNDCSITTTIVQLQLQLFNCCSGQRFGVISPSAPLRATLQEKGAGILWAQCAGSKSISLGLHCSRQGAEPNLTPFLQHWEQLFPLKGISILQKTCGAPGVEITRSTSD